ncbi:MAG: DUF1934 domain-containing protein [Acutalibacteraceae bacterium]|nr:DUF1934 domain-containing protein [Acutalibacteraceae bacterium]
MNNDYIIDIVGTQMVDGDEDVIEVTTTGGYTIAPTGNKFIRYKEYDTENPAIIENTTIKISDKQVIISRNGGNESQLMLELNKRHQCHYLTPVGSLLIGVYTKKMEIALDNEGGNLSVEYTLDFNSNIVSENKFDIKIKKN